MPAAQPQPTTAMDRATCTAALDTFVRLGFRQTTMAALADAIGVSRQTLYNRFGDKQAVLAHAANGLAEVLQADARRALDAADRPAGAVLLDAFDSWLGPLVALLQAGPHAQEILGLTKAARRLDHPNPLEGIDEPVAAFLVASGACPSAARARELTFLLAMAAKGLMLASTSTGDFRAGMARAIRGAGFTIPD